MKRVLLILASLTSAAWACDVSTIASAQKRFEATAQSAQAERDAILLEAARCHYESGRWREFFGLARYRRAFPTATEASEQLALLDVLASLRHCRFDRAKATFAEARPSGAPALQADRHRIELALAALPGDPKLQLKPGEKSVLARGIETPAMHWPVHFEDERIRQSDPFRMQVGVVSRCTEIEASR